MAEIVIQLNTLFDDVSFRDADRVALGKMAENESLQEQARGQQREAAHRPTQQQKETTR